MPTLLGDTPQLDLPPLHSSCSLRDRDYGSAEHIGLNSESGAEKLPELEDDHIGSGEWPRFFIAYLRNFATTPSCFD